MPASYAKKRKNKGKKMNKNHMALGQASTLAGSAWNKWRKHLLHVGPTWLFIAVTLTHGLCGRISEIMALKGEDFNFRHRYVRIKPLKRQPEARF